MPSAARVWLVLFLLGVNLVFLTWVGSSFLHLWHERQRLWDLAVAAEAQGAQDAAPRAGRAQGPLPESDPRCAALMNSLGDLSESLSGQGALSSADLEAVLKAQGCSPPAPRPPDGEGGAP